MNQIQLFKALNTKYKVSNIYVIIIINQDDLAIIFQVEITR